MTKLCPRGKAEEKISKDLNLQVKLKVVELVMNLEQVQKV
jgi:hypothetical protein